MKKILLKILLAIVILIGLGSIFVGYTDNRVIFTLKNSIPLELRMFIKKTFLFPFSHQNEINQLKK